MSRPIRATSVFVIFLLLTVATVFDLRGQRKPAPPVWPGPQGRGVTLLPNGWKIAPAGKSLNAGDLPLAMQFTPDGDHLVITNNGYSRPSLTVVDLKTAEIVQRLVTDHAWLGLVWHPNGQRLFSSGAAQNTINEFRWQDNRLTATGQFVLGRPDRKSPEVEDLPSLGFIGGISISPDGHRLYAVQVLGKRIMAVDSDSGRSLATTSLPVEPYTALASGDGRSVYVSLWGGAKVLELDAMTLALRSEVSVGEHPNAMQLSGDGRLLVACANTNSVYAIDLATHQVQEQIMVALFPKAPAGTTPNALALSPDGQTLFVANADNNTVAVVDIRKNGASVVRGHIPTGWYPTGVAVDTRRGNLLVLDGKGVSSSANPRGRQPGISEAPGQYIGQLIQGALSIVPLPDDAALKQLTQRTFDIASYSDATKLSPAHPPVASPIPSRVGGPSPIKHVFYVIRENRTYDQILGDLSQGNGDPNLTLFGEDVTPNAHAIATQFVLFDNFYVDAEVSYDGHAFSTGAYATDFIEKLWPTNYGHRGGVYLSEGEGEMRNAYGNVTAPADGYIWDFAKRANVSVRSYGEFARWDGKGKPVRETVPGLKGLVHPSYPPFDLTIPDNDRVDIWLEEFNRMDATGGVPQLSIIRLGDDHTSGTEAGRPTPRAMIAENDRALGRLLESISHSRIWSESAILVLEDDAQNGPDHVDAHRSVLLMASPFAKRGVVDSTLYTTSAVLRTMELVLGLPPMSQYDAAATPMYAAFQPTPVLKPFTGLPARIPLDERNTPASPGAAESARMDFREPDMAPEQALSRVIWQSVRGAGSVMPSPVRAGFIRPIEQGGQSRERDLDAGTGGAR
jgi:YVTN family beta-propeller protein